MTAVRVQKRLYYKIGDACKALGIQPYVLRYWETEFPALAPNKSKSGQRVYSERELAVIRRIKELLYDEGYTIAGAKKKLETELAGGEGDEAVPAETPAANHKAKGRANNKAEAKPPPPPEVKPQTELQLQPSLALDTDAGQRVQTLLSGVTEALQEAREILFLLKRKKP
jgi:DNA-binding transcriptional MerR regulator